MEQQDQYQDSTTYTENTEAPRRRGSKVSKMTTQAAKHVAGKAATKGRDFFYQTTLEERVVILASIITIVLSFLPWGAAISGGTVIELSGVSSFIYMMGFLTAASGVIALWSVFWVLLERPMPRFIENPARLHVLLGLEIMQIGIIAYTMFQASFTLTQDLEGKSTTLIALIVCGLAMMGAGIFEQNRLKKRGSATVLQHHIHHHDHSRSDEELQSIFGNEEESV